jgi:hypothetical protein
MVAKGLPGNLVAAILAGIIATVFIFQHTFFNY